MKNFQVYSNWVLPFIIGVAVFVAVVGPTPLYPTNIAWLSTGDPATHFLGWQFFRNTEWLFPVGLNPNYGMELSSAIIYSDSIPLLAILSKLFSPVLPETFQYFGIWLLVCFILQSWFGWKLVGLASDSIVIRALGAGFFAFSPPMIWRLYGHFSLVGHFLIVAALYLVLCPTLERRWLKWGVLLAGTASIHGYLLAMVGLLWLADLAGRTTNGEQTVRKSLGEFFALLAVIALVCWQVGYFSIEDGGVGGWGYSYYRMNLLSPIDSDNWSYILKDLPGGEGDYEGFNFLGLGGIAILFLAGQALVNGRMKIDVTARRRIFLLMALVGLTLFAISDNVGIGSQNFQIPVNDFLFRIASLFRSSGRMFWPVFYAIIFISIFVIVRVNSKKRAIGILSVALCAQIIDTNQAWNGTRRYLMTEPSSEWSTDFKDSFWDDAASRYTNVKWLLPAHPSPKYREISSYAVKYGLATGAVYLGRLDHSQLNLEKNKAKEALESGKYDPNTLYILEDKVLWWAAINLDSDSDLLAKIDGLHVLAPGWRKCASCPIVPTELTEMDVLTPLNRGEEIKFAQSSSGAKYLLDGWFEQEAWGTWSDGSVADMILPLSFNDPDRIIVEANALVSSSHPKQDVEVWVNGVLAASARLSAGEGNRIEVSIPDATYERLEESGYLRLQFRFPDAARPREIGMNRDLRQLALGLVSLTAL